MFRRPFPQLVGAFVVGFCATGLYVAAWDLFVGQSTCRAYQVGDCMGGPIAMAVVGLPVLYAVWAVGLRLTGARFAALAPLVVGIALFVVARILTPYETPVVVWVVIAAVLSSLWRLRFGPLPHPATRVSPGR